MSEISNETRRLLCERGIEIPILSGIEISKWINELKDEFDCFPIAVSILRVVGGLRVDETGPGEDLAKSDFVLDPSELEGEGDYICDHEEIVGGKLFPLGTANRGKDALVVDEHGHAYWLNDGGVFFYQDCEELVVSLIRGKKGKLIWPEENTSSPTPSPPSPGTRPIFPCS